MFYTFIFPGLNYPKYSNIAYLVLLYLLEFATWFIILNVFVRKIYFKFFIKWSKILDNIFSCFNGTMLATQIYLAFGDVPDILKTGINIEIFSLFMAFIYCQIHYARYKETIFKRKIVV